MTDWTKWDHGIRERLEKNTFKTVFKKCKETPHPTTTTKINPNPTLPPKSMQTSWKEERNPFSCPWWEILDLNCNRGNCRKQKINFCNGRGSKMLKQAMGGGCGVCINPVFRKEIYSRIVDPLGADGIDLSQTLSPTNICPFHPL